jgi:hypothetical protein
MTSQKRKDGCESFVGAEFQLLEFWQWASSDLLSNALRGRLAEFLVAKAVGVADGVRIEWDAVDIVSKSGCKIEVKSASYLQSWQQKRLSRIVFDIAPKQAWDAKTNTYSLARKRTADVYVFALLTEQARESVNPLDLNQWQFYSLAASILDEEVDQQKSIGLASLERLHPLISDFHGLNESIHRTQND